MFWFLQLKSSEVNPASKMVRSGVLMPSGCGFSSLNFGLISGLHGISYQLQTCPHGAKMTVMAPPSASSWWQAQWERGRAFSKSFKQHAQNCLIVSSESVTETKDVVRSGSQALSVE